MADVNGNWTHTWVALVAAIAAALGGLFGAFVKYSLGVRRIVSDETKELFQQYGDLIQEHKDMIKRNEERIVQIEKRADDVFQHQRTEIEAANSRVDDANRKADELYRTQVECVARAANLEKVAADYRLRVERLEALVHGAKQ